jgi:maleylacetoacetate isomerase
VQLYGYFRSSAAYRVRIALNLKGLSYESIPVHLQKEGGQNLKPEYRAVNPQGKVPTLAPFRNHVFLIQSLAIIEYLNETHPSPPLLPDHPLDRAKVRAFAQVIACDIHPLNNVAPLRYLKNKLGQEQAAIDTWYHHWIIEGFTALEALVYPIRSGAYAFGADITLADICLVPQVANARRLNVPLDRFPKLVAIDAACNKLDAFIKARPQNQPDAE